MASTLIKIGALTVDAADYEIPNERVFRDAWTFGANPEDGVITVDMDKAKQIWRDKIRLARTSALEALDTEFMKALETGADTSAIVAKKQALRDAPSDPEIDQAETPLDLKSIHPAGLTVK